MAIGFQNSVTTDAAAPGATIVLGAPSGTSATDILICAIGSMNAAGTAGSWTSPAGWTLIGTTKLQSTTAGGISMCTFWALGNVASFTFTKSGTVTSVGTVIAGFTGVDNTTPIDNSPATASNAGASSLSVTAITIANTNAWELICFNDFNLGTFSASGFTVVQDAGLHAATGILYNTTPLATGSTGAKTVSDSASAVGQGLIGRHMALKPATIKSLLGGILIANLYIEPEDY